MVLRDQAKNFVRKQVERRPDAATLGKLKLMRKRKPLALCFGDDGIVPNNPHLPVLIYRDAVSLAAKAFSPRAIIDALFEGNGWARSWRDTVYDFVHYHSQVHEVMGVARGRATIECGGVKGRRVKVKPGDVVVLPEGTGHRLIAATRDFQVVDALKRIVKVLAGVKTDAGAAQVNGRMVDASVLRKAKSIIEFPNLNLHRKA